MLRQDYLSKQLYSIDINFVLITYDSRKYNFYYEITINDKRIIKQRKYDYSNDFYSSKRFE